MFGHFCCFRMAQDDVKQLPPEIVASVQSNTLFSREEEKCLAAVRASVKFAENLRILFKKCVILFQNQLHLFYFNEKRWNFNESCFIF